MTSQEVKKIIQKATGCKDVILFDRKYNECTLNEVADVLGEDKTNLTKWFAEYNDCDDKAWMLKSAFVKRAYSTGRNYAFGIVGGNFPSPHMINWFIDQDRKLWYVEPQTDEIFEPKGNAFIFIA